MKLDEAQTAKVKSWVDEGLKLSDIQNKINSEFGLSMTYMEVRFLLDDLKVKPRDPVEPPQPKTASPPSVSPQPGDAAAPGAVRVGVDQLTRPGALASGKVTFSDGKQADWYLDQMGRLGLIPKEEGYKPSQGDIAQFQAELQNELARLGL